MANNKYLKRGSYVVKITSMRKIKNRQGNWVFRVDFDTLLDPDNRDCYETFTDYIKITDYNRLLDMQKSFIGLDFTDLSSVIGCQGIIRYNLGYINYVDLQAIANEENIDIDI